MCERETLYYTNVAISFLNFSLNSQITLPLLYCNKTIPASPWMSFHSKECATWSLTAESCAVKTLYWLKQGFCQASCARFGYPYEDTNCCESMPMSAPTPTPPTSPPTPSPSSSPVDTEIESTNRSDNNCVVCDDRQTPYMIGNDKECPTWSFVSTRCKEKTTYWERNRFCRFTCANLGYPYEGDDNDVCCGVSPIPTDEPSVKPSLSPSALPSSSPSTVPSSSPTSTPSAQPSSNPSALPSSMPSTLPSRMPSALPSMLPSTSPLAGPSSNPSASPTDAVAPDTNDDCVPCTNVPSSGMSGRGLTCEGWHKVEDRCYDKRPGWINKRYCELGCYIAGFPYDHAKKCCLDVTPRNNIVPTPSPSPEPSHMPSTAPTSKPTPPEIDSDNRSCIECHDKRTPWMVANDKYCNSWSVIPYRCTEQSSVYNFWAQEKFCQQSCSDAGHPYPGDVCCPPTPAPTPVPTPLPTPDPSEEGNCFAFTRDCGADKPCADANACCSAWGHCGYGQEWCGACCQGGNCNDSGLRFLRGGGNTFLVNNMTAASFDEN